MSTEVAALLVATLSIAVVALIGAFTESEFSKRFASVAEDAPGAVSATSCRMIEICSTQESVYVGPSE